MILIVNEKVIHRWSTLPGIELPSCKSRQLILPILHINLTKLTISKICGKMAVIVAVALYCTEFKALVNAGANIEMKALDRCKRALSNGGFSALGADLWRYIGWISGDM